MGAPRVVWNEVGSAVVSLMASARRHSIVIAPFITGTAFGQLLEALPFEAELLVITRWRASDVAAGISDTCILDRVAERSGRLLLHPSLHAKVYVADKNRALVGSANVTNSALGFTHDPNREVLVELEPLPSVLHAFIRRIEKEAVEASEEFRRKIEEAAERLRLSPRQADDKQACMHAGVIREWYPTLRNPARLYTLYQSLEDAAADEREAAIDDLAEIAIADGLNECDFRDAVVRHLTSCAHLTGR